MKITITDEAKKIITVAEMPAVRKIVECMKEDECTVKGYAEQAARVASGCNVVRVLEANAKIAKNCRVNDYICEGSAQFDIWFDFVAMIDDGYKGFVMGGAYLTDIWQICRDNADEICQHMYIRKFVEAK